MKEIHHWKLNELKEIEIRSPRNKIEMVNYFYLRWFILRSEFSKNIESVKDDLENSSFHVMAIFENKVLGVGRIHNIDDYKSQIRYMAVDSNAIKQGIGRKILLELINKAKSEGRQKIILHSRENAIDFYKKNGFIEVEKSHKIFNSIQHYLMEKAI